MLFGVELFALFVHLHLFGQRIGHVKLDLFTGLFKRCSKFAGLTGKPGHHGFGLDCNIRFGFNGGDLFTHHWRNQFFIRIRHGQLAAPVERGTAQLGLFFHQRDLVAGLGRVHGSRHTGDTTTDYQNLFGKIVQFVRLGQIDFFDPRHTHFEVVFGHHLDAIELFFILFFFFGQYRKFGSRMRPDHAFAQIDALNDAAIETECIEHDSAGAGTQHQGIDAAFNLLFQEFNTFFAAQDGLGFGCQTLFVGDPLDGFNIQGFADATTFANIDTILFVHG